jgi:MoaA/NifB/PqqE/SkfB family radical SAM enzyme
MAQTDQPLYQSRRPLMCRFPWVGMTIMPEGRIVPCCGAPSVTLGHLDENVSLDQHIQGEAQGLLRDSFEQAEWPAACVGCRQNREAGRPALMDYMADRYLPWSEEDYREGRARVRYLEVTASNACNATCATCGSRFSSAWQGWDRAAVAEGLTWRDSDQEFRVAPEQRAISPGQWARVEEAMTTVEYLMLKGGEPLMDHRNLGLLERLLALGRSPTISIITNFARVTEPMLDLLARFPRLNLSVSIDAVGDLYEWIRSTPYARTRENLERWHRRTGRQVTVLTTVSLYNYTRLEETVRTLLDLPAVARVNLLMVHQPLYTSAAMILPDRLDRLRREYEGSLWIGNNPRVERPEIATLMPSALERNPVEFHHNRDRVSQWIEFLDRRRPRPLLEIDPDLAPILAEIRESRHQPPESA